MRGLDLYGWAALVAVLLGGICWGFVGIFNVSLLTAIFGEFLGRLMYIGVAGAAGYLCYLVYQDKFKRI